MSWEYWTDKTTVLKWRNVMLDFNKQGMKELHILSEGMNYPVAIHIYTDWQETQFQYLLDSIRTAGLSSYDICKWCIAHKFKYRVVYPLDRKTIFRNPYKYLKYLEMIIKLKMFSYRHK